MAVAQGANTGAGCGLVSTPKEAAAHREFFASLSPLMHGVYLLNISGKRQQARERAAHLNEQFQAGHVVCPCGCGQKPVF
jgi:hypothetical protein